MFLHKPPALCFRRIPPRVSHSVRSLSVASDAAPPSTHANDFQKELKAARKARAKSKSRSTSIPPGWRITCGLEIHAQLNTPRKLFSGARTSFVDEPNTHVAVFDAAAPGSQPLFQKTTLLPALRAAVALQCEVQGESRFDRKHYFYWDQPAGYQITQYYKPLAKDGQLRLTRDEDGIEESEILIGIRQVQIEQDTAKTITQEGGPGIPSVHLIDYNRVSHPLVEIITTPSIHTPEAAGAAFKKIQAILKAVGAATLGMEWGGIRCDVNVSVNREGDNILGQRCEIKNLSSIKAVQDAVEAEAKRQVELLESGEVVLGETRGWEQETKTTRRLRGKEGEVDYRYMPDPDIPPLLLSRELVGHIKETLPLLPSQQIEKLTTKPYGLTLKDAKTLVFFEDERLLPFYYEVVEQVCRSISKPRSDVGVVCGNWVIHNLLGALTIGDLAFEANPVDSTKLGDMVALLLEGKLTGPTAKALLNRLVLEPTDADANTTILDIATKENLLVAPLSDSELSAVIQEALFAEDPQSTKMRTELLDLAGQAADKRTEKRRKGLESFFMGKVMRQLGGKVDAVRVEAVIREAVEKSVKKG